jgi:hypothetical protein
MLTSTRPHSVFVYIGIAGAITMAISDMILLGVPQAGWEGDLSSFSSLAYVAMWRIRIGPLLGWVSSFFICFGFWYVREGLSSLHPRLPLIMFVALASMMIFGGAFHAGYYFAGAALHEGNLKLYESFVSQLKIMSYVSSPGVLIGSAIYSYLLASVPNDFPKWMKFVNPIVLQGLCLAVFSLLPAPIGGFLKPAFINIATIIFFSLHLWAEKTKNPELSPGFS